jgi:hypothetical protein
MNKRLGIAVPAAMAAGVLLLTACENGGATSSASTTSSTTATTSSTSTTSSSTSVEQSTSVPSTTVPDAEGDLQPVHCGEVTLDSGAVHGVIARPTLAGVVGCTEAFNVIDEFVNLPQEKRAEASLGDVTLPNTGWTCTVDDGVKANISCNKDGFELATEQQAG